MGRNPYHLWLVFTVAAIISLTAHFYLKFIKPRNITVTELQGLVALEPIAEVTDQKTEKLVLASKPPPVKWMPNPKETLDSLRKRLGTTITMDTSEKGDPFRLTGTVKIKDLILPNESQQSGIRRYLEMAAPVIGVDHPEQLKLSGSPQLSPLGQIHNFTQDLNGIPIEGGQVRIHQDNQGNIFMVNSTYVSGVNGVSTKPLVSPEDALSAAITHAKSLDPQQKIPDHGEPLKVIYKFNDTGIPELCFKIVIRQYHLGGTNAVGVYFVSAQDATHFERVRGAFQ